MASGYWPSWVNSRPSASWASADIPAFGGGSLAGGKDASFGCGLGSTGAGCGLGSTGAGSGWRSTGAGTGLGLGWTGGGDGGAIALSTAACVTTGAAVATEPGGASTGDTG